MPDILGFLRRRRKEEEEIPAKKQATAPPPEPFVVGDMPKYKKRPNLIFIGSGKGGVGKSMLSANLVAAVAMFSNNPAYGVDLDLDSFTLSKVLLPADFHRRVIEKRGTIGRDEMLNFASVLINGSVPSKAILPLIRVTGTTCKGAQVQAKYSVVPAYNVLYQKEQEVTLRSLTASLLLAGLNELVAFFEKKVAENRSAVVVFDGKQKSNIGIEYEPLYRLMVERADVFVMPVEAPHLSFTEIIAPYRDVLDKLIIVVNRAEPAIQDKIVALATDALDMNIPVFVVPNAPGDGDLFRNKYTVPLLDNASRPTAVSALVLARFLNLVDDNIVNAYGCDKVYSKLKSYGELFERLRRR